MPLALPFERMSERMGTCVSLTVAQGLALQECCGMPAESARSRVKFVNQLN